MTRLLMTLPFCRAALLLATAALTCACSTDAQQNDACTPDDADGVISEPANPELIVTDSEFMPKIVTTQNSSAIKLKLTNEGRSPHGFVVDCLPTPNTDGCPTKSCFPSEAKIEPLEPGADATIMFDSPLVEGIYTFRSDVAGDDELKGQFVIQ